MFWYCGVGNFEHFNLLPVFRKIICQNLSIKTSFQDDWLENENFKIGWQKTIMIVHQHTVKFV